MKKLVFLTIPFGLSACGSADLQTVWQDVSDLDKLFEPEQRKGVAVTKGYPIPNASVYSPSVKQDKKVAIKQSITHERINTTQCKDADDWYLDGYRVGRSFASQKAAMYQQRVSYCKGMLSHADQFQQNWEKGFKVGVKKA
ncbi:hypothetical protein [Actinobacillus pleuropneumoniae]|uniref:Lipoprotein n=1 Tax=Actinobacillus pleuropneumoniae TaxID=715 RepID=A0A3S4Y0F6_ACTPL|nr:hypothetical protein [Actinobacillus pleuropneumoniae]EFL79160.1 hypothetical protein APP2_1163 [Actinobacillus pleuropneumoniae serovar 2 str. 4226]EFM88191.1 hypothetical protein appser2_5260 [Actinobacillus pleuropneumoniae serovar 2 str. S1536]MEE3618468.1 hypothetical protein [Actinobacillus pleuropneumoniae]UKH08832.1 hypothetical protein KZH40_02750 [Actinobacillus pleuropneumoniae]UKH45270.1 hypothetical protein D1095_02755 [Actinobacillus pleuropneumoniae serovar 2 str. S1536]